MTNERVLESVAPLLWKSLALTGCPPYCLPGPYRKDLSAEVARIAVAHSVDVVVLAENTARDASLTKALRHATGRQFASLPAHREAEDTSLYHDADKISVHLIRDGAQGTFVSLSPPQRQELLLVAAHLPSRLHAEDLDQMEFARQLRDEIDEVEAERGHDRTIVVGDLNMHPFDDGVVAAAALHAVMDRSVARAMKRKVGGRFQKFFYNPMWGCMGDRTPGPSGTYHYRGVVQRCFFWHTFDQVLLRPKVMDGLGDQGVTVVAMAGGRSLLTKKGLPDKRLSDHLPIVFRLDLPRHPE